MWGRAGVVGLLVAALVVVLPAEPVAAIDGAVLSSSTVYRIDPDRPAVNVETTYRFTNVKPDRQLGGGEYEYYFFTGLDVPIDPTASEISVEINGRPGSFTVEEIDGYRALAISFGYELRYQRTATVVVRSVLLGRPPRDPDSWVRVNPAYVSFPVYPWGDDGEVDVRIETPVRWVTDYVGGDLSERVENGVLVHEAIGIESPLDFGVLFTARNDHLLEWSELRVGDAVFAVRSWPGDDEWATFATGQIRDGVPVLSSLLATPWPIHGRLSVVEASTPYLRGYAGFFSSADQLIEIGEELDRQTFLHELAHAWINHARFGDRWIVEGLAEEVASRAVAALGEELPEPLTDADLRADGIEFQPFPLTTWTASSGGAVDDGGVEDYGYSASAQVMRALHDEIGADAMTELLAAMLAGRRAYPNEDGPVTTAGEPIGWQELLDLAEQLAGSTQLQRQYRDLVLTDSQIDTLEQRNEVVAAYAELSDRSGSWYPPTTLRDDMAAWRLHRALDGIETANAVLDERDALWDALAPIGLTHPRRIEGIYEVGGGDELLSTVRSLIDNAEKLVAAREELAVVLGAIEQDVPELRQVEYEESPSGALTTTRELVDAAGRLRTTLEELAAVLDDHGNSVPPLAADAFADDPAAAQGLVDEQLAAAVAVDAAHDADADAGSLLATVGRWGSDVHEQLTAADGLLADGDTRAAIAAAREAADAIDGLDETGMRRVGYTGVATALVLLAALVLLVRRRRGLPDEELPEAEPDVRCDGVRHGVARQPDLADAADPSAGEADAGEAGAVDTHV